MIKDIINLLDIDFEKAIIDNYQLKDGLYVKINEKPDFFVYKKPKKDDKEKGLKDLKGNIKIDEYKWFAKRDYLSSYLNSNKAIDPPAKKIHNNNYLTLFTKAKEFNDENKSHFISKIYDGLKDFHIFTKKEEKKIIESFKGYIFSEIRQKDIENKKNKFLEIFDEIKKKKNLVKDNEYIKIFFDEDIEKYEKEANIYFALKIFNKIETVREIEGEIYGLSDFNMGLNAKKPYLTHKTRGFELPFMVKKDEVFLLKKLFDLLKYQNKPIDIAADKDKNGIFVIKHSKNDQAEITEFDILVKGNRLNPSLVYRDFLENKEDEEIKTYNSLFELIDKTLYNGTLKNNLFGDVYNKLPKELQNLIYLTRDAMILVKKGDLKPLFVINKKYTDRFIEFYLRQNREDKAKEVLNFKLSLLNYQGEKMDIKKSLKEIENKIVSLEELSEEEFFILAGQIIRYLLNQSEKKDKRADMIEPFLRASRVKKLKQEIETLYFNYKHKIPLNFQKFNNALALVEAFEGNKVKKDKLLVGILSENIFYKKDEK
jgi:CRISPR-associated protein Csh1